MSNTEALRLLKATTGAMLQQAVCAAADLGIADQLNDGERTSSDLAAVLNLNEDALYRVLRFLSGEGVFIETMPRRFANSKLSQFLRTDIPGSLRSAILYMGRQQQLCTLEGFLDSMRTGKPARETVLGMNTFEHLRQNTRDAAVFDDAMAEISALWAPEIASAYDFGKWGSLMDVGGGNGLLLAEILRIHTGLTGVLAEQAHVLRRARESRFLSGDIANRVQFAEANFFDGIPGGCRAYLMKSVLHDWDDDRALQILCNCRKAVPDDGACLIVENCFGETNSSWYGNAADVRMLMGTGGRERTTDGYGELVGRAGFQLTQVVPLDQLMLVEARPQ